MGPLEVRLQSGSPQDAADDRAERTGITKTAMGCPASDENTPCGAGWAILPQVGSDRLSDILRKRKVVMITTLATDREHSGPPIDIIEFQSDDFARSQPQAGQEEKDSVIATSDRCAAIARLDNPFDLVRLQVSGHTRELPGSHGRNGPCQVTLGLSVSEEKPEKGAECRHHQLGHSWAAGTGVPKQETRDVVRGQFLKTNVFCPKTFHKETSEERPIPGDCYGRKTAFLQEIVLIPFLQCCQRRLIDHCLRRLNKALVTQVLKEVMDRSRRTFSEASLASQFVEELFQHLLVQSADGQMLPLEPSFELGQNLQPLPHCRSGIAEFGDSSSE
jgi:hypothetical protein